MHSLSTLSLQGQAFLSLLCYRVGEKFTSLPTDFWLDRVEECTLRSLLSSEQAWEEQIGDLLRIVFSREDSPLSFWDTLSGADRTTILSYLYNCTLVRACVPALWEGILRARLRSAGFEEGMANTLLPDDQYSQTTEKGDKDTYEGV